MFAPSLTGGMKQCSASADIQLAGANLDTPLYELEDSASCLNLVCDYEQTGTGWQETPYSLVGCTHI